MTEAEARRLAAEEGLALLPAGNSTGWKGISKVSGSKTFQAQIKQSGKKHTPRQLR